MAKLTEHDVPGFNHQPGESCDEFYKRTSALLDEMTVKANALPEGEFVGAILSFPIADGKALYLVAKAQPLTLTPIPFMDGYQIPDAYIRGLTLDDVRDQVKRAKAMAALFARPRT
jgi:hypothetical protein